MSSRSERRERREAKIQGFKKEITEDLLECKKDKNNTKNNTKVMTALARRYPQERHLLTAAAREMGLQFELDLVVAQA